MKTIEVKASRPYHVRVERGGILSIGDLSAKLKLGARCLVVADTNVSALYGDSVLQSLRQSGVEAACAVYQAGEQSKTLRVANDLYTEMVAHGMTRDDYIIALGGGVCGDLAGFVAATYLRGIDFIQVPTSLLAQIDSSVGGKVAVDLEQGKNLVGAFHQPRLVLCDPDVLRTLPHRYFIDGLGEMLKYALTYNATLFETLSRGVPDNLTPHIISCIEQKRDVVERDEFEAGERMVLNFGHTVGHAIERTTGFVGYSHGEAVAIGMQYAAEIGYKLGVSKIGLVERVADAARVLGLPTACGIDANRLADAIEADKKRTGENVRFVLLQQIGQATVCDIRLSELRQLLREVSL